MDAASVDIDRNLPPNHPSDCLTSKEDKVEGGGGARNGLEEGSLAAVVSSHSGGQVIHVSLVP